MPRTGRASVGGVVYHVLNRGNARQQVFFDTPDYAAWVELLGQAQERLAMPVLAYQVMPNHVHLVLWPRGDGDLGRWMQWLMTSHVRSHHRRHGGSGHVWQGRFKAFPVQSDDHLLAVMRYVERNALRANLVGRAEAWPWSSLPRWARADRPGWLVEGPVPRPADWLEWVNGAQTAAELEALRGSVNRGTPFGDPRWTRRTAGRLGLEASLHPRGRPRKEPKK